MQSKSISVMFAFTQVVQALAAGTTVRGPVGQGHAHPTPRKASRHANTSDRLPAA
jgi:hypothetical protein